MNDKLRHGIAAAAKNVILRPLPKGGGLSRSSGEYYRATARWRGIDRTTPREDEIGTVALVPPPEEIVSSTFTNVVYVGEGGGED